MGNIWEGVIIKNQVARKEASLAQQAKDIIYTLKDKSITEKTHLNTDIMKVEE